VKLVPGQLNYLALPPGQTTPFDVGALQRAGLPIAPYIEHGSWETGQPDIMFYGRDPYRGVMGMLGNYVSFDGLGKTGTGTSASTDVPVINVQNRLNQEGQSLTADGIWGTRTRTALEAFARSSGVRLPAFNTATYKLVNNRTVRLPAALATAFVAAAGAASPAGGKAPWTLTSPAGAGTPGTTGKLIPGASAVTEGASAPWNISPSTASTITSAMDLIGQLARPRSGGAAPAAPLPAQPAAPFAPLAPLAPEPEAAAPNRTMLYVGLGVGAVALLGLAGYFLTRKKSAP
jgi:hypothetical protein